MSVLAYISNLINFFKFSRSTWSTITIHSKMRCQSVPPYNIYEKWSRVYWVESTRFSAPFTHFRCLPAEMTLCSTILSLWQPNLQTDSKNMICCVEHISIPEFYSLLIVLLCFIKHNNKQVKKNSGPQHFSYIYE